MSKKPKTQTSASPKSPARKRTATTAPKGVRGRPFGSGLDPRRNLKGRGKAQAKGDPYQIALAALMAPVKTITNGRRQKKPRLRVILDQQLVPASQGDQSAVRATATLLRAVNALRHGPEQAQPVNKSTVHDERALERIIDDWERRAAKGGSARDQRKRSQPAK